MLADKTPFVSLTVSKAKPSGQAGPDDIIKARLIAENAKEVSQPDN